VLQHLKLGILWNLHNFRLLFRILLPEPNHFCLLRTGDLVSERRNNHRRLQDEDHDLEDTLFDRERYKLHSPPIHLRGLHCFLEHTTGASNNTRPFVCS